MLQALNNIAVLYHYQGSKASDKKEFELAQNHFKKASSYWKKAIRLASKRYWSSKLVKNKQRVKWNWDLIKRSHLAYLDNFFG